MLASAAQQAMGSLAWAGDGAGFSSGCGIFARFTLTPSSTLSRHFQSRYPRSVFAEGRREGSTLPLPVPAGALVRGERGSSSPPPARAGACALPPDALPLQSEGLAPPGRGC